MNIFFGGVLGFFSIAGGTLVIGLLLKIPDAYDTGLKVAVFFGGLGAVFGALAAASLK